MLKLKNTDLVFATFHVDVGETPFFISIDHDKEVIVISIRGTLSMKVTQFMFDYFASLKSVIFQPVLYCRTS